MLFWAEICLIGEKTTANFANLHKYLLVLAIIRVISGLYVVYSNDFFEAK